MRGVPAGVRSLRSAGASAVGPVAVEQRLRLVGGDADVHRVLHHEASGVPTATGGEIAESAHRRHMVRQAIPIPPRSAA
jgi:hypothetical protein